MARQNQVCAGEPSTWALIPGTCTVVLTNGEGVAQPINFDFLLDKVVFPPAEPSTFDYNPANHTVTHNGIPHQLNCGQLGFDQATCSLTYLDEKNVLTSIPLPQDQVLYNPMSCTVTVLPAKGGAPVVFPVGVPAGDVGLVMEGKNLEFTYKDKKCVVPLPNSVIGCQYDGGTNTIRMLFCDGTFDEKALAKASLICSTLDDGTQVLVFNDGCGGQKMFNIPNVVIPVDTDQPPTVVGSVLTFVYGGDGNDANVSIDICQIVADNCNATITNIDPVTGAFSFIDNAGATFSVPGHVPPQVVTTGDLTLNETIGPNGEVIYSIGFDHVESDPAPVVMGADDAVVTPSIGANGEVIYTVSCIKPIVVGDGAVTVTPSLGPNGETIYTVSAPEMEDCCHYHLTSTAMLVIGDPTDIVGAPEDKTVGDTAQQKHPNGFSNWTCAGGGWVLDFVCIIPEASTPFDPAKETFLPGDTLPAGVAPTQVCVRSPAGVEFMVTVGAGQTLPDGMLGALQVDETDGSTVYIPPKSTDHPSVGSPDGTVGVVYNQQTNQYELSRPLVPVNLVNGADVELVPNQGPDGDAFCVQEPLLHCPVGTTNVADAVPVPKGFVLHDTCVRTAALAHGGINNVLGPDMPNNFDLSTMDQIFNVCVNIPNETCRAMRAVILPNYHTQGCTEPGARIIARGTFSANPIVQGTNNGFEIFHHEVYTPNNPLHSYMYDDYDAARSVTLLVPPGGADYYMALYVGIVTDSATDIADITPLTRWNTLEMMSTYFATRSDC